jgi:hypothetical protein
MHHAITWASLFGVGGIVGGLLLIATGALALFAGGMSDAPQAGDNAGRLGIGLALLGATLFALGIWAVA